jgi:uncharacterized OsmC-like protein
MTLKQVDELDLKTLADKAEADPSTGRKVLKSKTVCEGGFRNLSYIRQQSPVLIDEPCQLLGEDNAPNPSEMALAALGSCLLVGFMANATARGIKLEKLEVELEGDIDISAVWGVASVSPETIPGFTEVRAVFHVDADADATELAEIERVTLEWSPVLNTFTRQVAFQSSISRKS